jgi:hypothetical protein
VARNPGLAVLAALCLSPLTTRAQVSLVPADHPVYEWLYRQRVAGRAPGYSLESLPLSRGQIAGLVAALAADSALPAADRARQRRYADEFASNLERFREPNTLLQGGDSGLSRTLRRKVRLLFSDQEPHLFRYGSDEASLTVDYRWGNGVIAFDEAGDRDADRYGFGGFRGYGTLYRQVGFHLEVVNPYGGSALRYHPQWRATHDVMHGNQSTIFGQGFVSARFGVLSLDVGSGSARVGAGTREAVILRTFSPNFDWVRLRLETPALQYTALHGALQGPTRYDSIPGIPGSLTRVSPARWIALRRLQVRPWSSLQLAFSEALVYSNRGLELAYVNPVYPLKLGEFGTGDKDNPVWFVDAVWRPFRSVELSGTLGIDDMASAMDVLRATGRRSNGDLTTKLLYQGGVSLALPTGTDLSAEYLRVDPFFYTHHLLLNTFEQQGFALANDLGPNADEIWVAVRQWNPWGWVRASLRRVRQGLNLVDAQGRVVSDVGGDLRSAHRGQRVIFLAGDVHHWRAWGVDALVEPWPGVSFRVDYERRDVTRGTRIPDRHLLRTSLTLSFYPVQLLLAPFGI